MFMALWELWVSRRRKPLQKQTPEGPIQVASQPGPPGALSCFLQPQPGEALMLVTLARLQ